MTACGFDPVAVLTAKWSDKAIGPTVLKECFLLEKWPRTGVPLRSLPLPVENGTELQYGGVIDFDAIAVKNVSLRFLKIWLHSRKVYTGMMTLKDTIKKVAAIRAMANTPNTLHNPTATIPADIEQNVVAPPLAGPAPWFTGEEFLNVARKKIPLITEELVAIFLALAQSSPTPATAAIPCLKNRSLNLLEGHINPTTFRVSEGRMRGSDVKCHIVNAMTIASSQGKVYNVVMVFDDFGNYVPDGSCCKCVEGQSFCSHMISLVETLAMFQDDDNSYADVVSILPEAIDGLQGMPVPLNYILDILRESSRMKKAGKKERNKNNT